MKSAGPCSPVTTADTKVSIIWQDRDQFGQSTKDHNVTARKLWMFEDSTGKHMHRKSQKLMICRNKILK